MYYISPDNRFPLYIGDIRLEHPTFARGDSLPEGWREVVEVEPPEKDRYEVLVRNNPEEIDGVLTEVWTKREMTTEEREKKDAPITVKQKLIDLGLTEVELQALLRGLVR